MRIVKNLQIGGAASPALKISIALLGTIFLSLIISRMIYPFGVGTWEAFNWMPATHLLEGVSPYSYAFEPPYGMSPYGIVYYALIAVGVKLFGFQMWFGRLLSVAAFLVCVWAVATVTRRLAENKEAIWLAVLAAVAMFPSQMWVAVMRSDLIAAAFVLSALALAFKAAEEQSISPWMVAALILLSSAGFFTKPTFWLEPGIIFLRFLQIGKRREALAFAIGMSAVVFGGMLILDQTSSGGYIWQHFIHARRLPYSLADAAWVFTEMLKTPAFLVTLAFLVVFVWQRLSAAQTAENKDPVGIISSARFLLFCYLILSLIWSFLAAGRLGGNVNYYLENSFVLAIGAGLIFDDLKSRGRARAALAMIVLLAIGGTFQMARVWRGEYFRWQSLSYYREIYATVGRIVSPDSKCISIYPELVVWNGCTFNFDDFEEYDGTWSPELGQIFQREINAGGYAAIVWYDDKFTYRFPNYRLVKMTQPLPEKFFPIYLYVPQEATKP